MKKILLFCTFLTGVLIVNAQEWDDPITTTDWDQLWKSAFVQSNNATHAPESSGWFWGLNMNHSSNNASYRYNGQIAIKNDHDVPTMYYRSTNADGSGIWAKVINSKASSIGTLTTLNSLRVNGTNLDGKDLSFLSNSGSTVVGWNRSRGHGETAFISNRGLGSRGGFEFRDIDNSGNETLLLKIQGDGTVGIGTSNPDSDYKLSVNGAIRSKEVKVETSWSDFVFDPDYDLPTLEEVAQHIAENGHLPEIPSEAEVTENGINLGEMDAKLLQKIEELTLYMIEQHQENQRQRKLIEVLQQEVANLKSFEKAKTSN